MIKVGDLSFLEVSYLALKKVNKYEDVYVTVLRRHVEDFNIDEFITKVIPEAKILIMEVLTNGPAESAYNAIARAGLKGEITIADCDQAFGVKPNGSQHRIGSDVLLYTFASENSAHSFLKIVDGKIQKIEEKSKISNTAIAGSYVFYDARIFMSYYEQMALEQQEERFISQLVNKMLLDGKMVTSEETTWHRSFGTPEELEAIQADDLIQKLMMDWNTPG